MGGERRLAATGPPVHENQTGPVCRQPPLEHRAERAVVDGAPWRAVGLLGVQVHVTSVAHGVEACRWPVAGWSAWVSDATR